MSTNSAPRLRLPFDASEAYCIVLVLAYDSVSKGDTSPKDVTKVSMMIAVKKWIPVVYQNPKYTYIKFGKITEIELNEIAEKDNGKSMIKS